MHFFPEKKRNKDFYFYGRGVFQITVVAEGELEMAFPAFGIKGKEEEETGFALVPLTCERPLKAHLSAEEKGDGVFFSLFSFLSCNRSLGKGGE